MNEPEASVMDVSHGTQLLSTGEAAKLCSVKPDTVLKWIKKGLLEAARTAGGHYRIHRADIEPLRHGRRFGDLTCPPPPRCTPQPLRCWEYMSGGGEVSEECKRCVVYRVRAAWCFQVAGLGRDIGHAKHFCRTSCQDCSYYRRVRGMAAHVLVITSDRVLVQALSRDSGHGVAFQIAGNPYEASAAIEGFHPGFLVLDRDTVGLNEADLMDCLARDPRVPGLKVILAIRQGAAEPRIPPAYRRMVVGVLHKPFGPAKVAEVIESLPVEALAAS